MKSNAFSILTLIVLMILNGCQTTGDPAKVSIITPEDSLQLRHLKEVEWPTAYHQQDTLLLDRILAEEFQLIDAAGSVTSKDEEMEWLRAHHQAPDSFRYQIQRLDIFKNGTAIISGTGHIINDTTETLYSSSNVLIKRNGIWRAVSSHVSGIREH